VTTPTISIKRNGRWVPVNSLPKEERGAIRQRMAGVFREALEQQIALRRCQ
jgi:hypothetical protein